MEPRGASPRSPLGVTLLKRLHSEASGAARSSTFLTQHDGGAAATADEAAAHMAPRAAPPVEVEPRARGVSDAFVTALEVCVS